MSIFAFKIAFLSLLPYPKLELQLLCIYIIISIIFYMLSRLVMFLDRVIGSKRHISIQKWAKLMVFRSFFSCLTWNIVKLWEKNFSSNSVRIVLCLFNLHFYIIVLWHLHLLNFYYFYEKTKINIFFCCSYKSTINNPQKFIAISLRERTK